MGGSSGTTFLSMKFSWFVALILVCVFLIVLVVFVILSLLFKQLRKIFGMILFIPGLFVTVFAFVRYILLESQIIRAFGEPDMIMVLCFVLGGIGMVIGAILFAIGSAKNKTSLESSHSPIAPGISNYVVKVRCPNCQELNDETSKFCYACGHLMNPPSLET